MLKTKQALTTIFLLFSGFWSTAQDQSVFQSDVETFKKPWTNLEFYNDPENFQFALVSDLWGGYRAGVFDDAVSKLNLLYPEFVLSVGDLISGKIYDTLKIAGEWSEFNQKAEGLKMPFFYLPGNHDITNQVMAKEWEKRFGRRYYYFIYKKVLFLILDSNDNEEFLFSEKQVEYAREVLKDHTDVRWTFVLMHHPAWEYETGGRFGKIEQALSDRKFTVIAGHRHHYHYEKRNGNNYYVLSTTGAGNRLRGNYFGEFDHITWITMTDEGPAMSNLRLDGILPHDIATDETYALAEALGENTRFEHVILTDNSETFSNGTLYLHFKNNGDKPMKIDLRFFHQHQINILNPRIDVSLSPGTGEVVEIPLTANSPLKYGDIEALQLAWKMKIDALEYTNFELKGNYNFPVKPTKTDCLRPKIPAFLNDLKITVDTPFKGLMPVVKVDGKPVDISGNGIFHMDESGTVGMILRNDRNQQTVQEQNYYQQLTRLNKSVRVRNLENGLRCMSYEGEWEEMPDLSKLKPVKVSVAKDYWVDDYATRYEHFALAFKGYVYADEDELYLFRAQADDVCQVYIDGKLILDVLAAKSNEQGVAALKKGYHKIEIRYLQIRDKTRLRVYYKKTYDPDFRLLDFDMLYHRQRP